VRPHAIACFVLAAACSEPDFWAFSSRPIEGEGLTVVAVWVSDSPVDAAESVYVAVDRVELDGLVLAAGRREFDYLALRNGNRALLARAEVPPGTYARLRLRLAPDGHRVVTDGATVPLAVGDARVLDFAGPFRVREHETLELQADLNLRQSVLETGGTWQLDPVWTLTDASTAAFIDGVVSDIGGGLLAGVTVSAQEAGAELASTRTGQDGTFRLGPLPAGRYDLVAPAPGLHPAALHGAASATGGHVLVLRTAETGTLRGRTAAAGAARVARLMRDGLLVALAGIDPATGAFEFPDVAAGLYDVEIRGAAGLLEVLRGAETGPP